MDGGIVSPRALLTAQDFICKMCSCRRALTTARTTGLSRGSCGCAANGYGFGGRSFALRFFSTMLSSYMC